MKEDLEIYFVIDVTDAPIGYRAPWWRFNRETGCWDVLQGEYRPGNNFRLPRLGFDWETRSWEMKWNSRTPESYGAAPKESGLLLRTKRFYPGIPEPPAGKKFPPPGRGFAKLR